MISLNQNHGNLGSSSGDYFVFYVVFIDFLDEIRFKHNQEFVHHEVYCLIFVG